jgi:hypothetical protein
MAFTANEIASVANASLDYYFNRGETFKQSVQQRPLLSIMEGAKKTFPGGKGNISIGVKGVSGDGSGNDVLKGYTHNDLVNFFTPANIKRANYPWREHHIGLTLTHTELKIDGISVVDTNGERTTEHSRRDMTVLVGLLEDKLYELGEQYSISMNNLLWGDGVADAKALAGIQSIITVDPSVGVVGGIDRATNPWWRNRARTTAFGVKVTGTPALAAWGGDKVTAAATNGGALITLLQGDYRQMVRYGGKPNKFLAGSDFIAAIEMEFRANGYYTNSGFASGADVSVGAMKVPGGATVEYDPTLDSLGKSKFAYWFDSRRLFLETMEDEWRKEHTPSRPANQFVLYRSITSTGQLVSTQNNCHEVIEIA